MNAIDRIRVLLVAIVSLGMLTSCGPRTVSGDEDARTGAQLLMDGKHQEAAATLQSALSKGLSEEKPEQVYTCLGNAYNGLEEWDKAIEAHKKAIEANPDYHKSWVNLGIVHRQTDNLPEAEKCYRKALELAPDYAELHASMGVLFIRRGKNAEAVESLEKAIELDTELAVAWGNLSLAYATVGRFDDADAALAKAVALGYKNGPKLRAHIDGLKASASG